jgi:hypothetical protein
LANGYLVNKINPNMEKQCRKCQDIKPIEHFQTYSRNSDGLQPYCRPCKRLIDREHYKKNPRRNYERNKANAHRNRVWLYEYLKTKKCEWENCLINDPDMLVFDHLNPNDKHLEVSQMVQRSYSLKTIMAEVAKCRILCANHHQKHTIQQFGYRSWLKDSQETKKSDS